MLQGLACIFQHTRHIAFSSIIVERMWNGVPGTVHSRPSAMMALLSTLLVRFDIMALYSGDEKQYFPVAALNGIDANRCWVLFCDSAFIMSQTCMVSGIMDYDFHPLQERDICTDEGFRERKE